MTLSGIEPNQSLSSQPDTSSQATDVESKGIQNQITAAQQKLQKLSSDQELTAEEKKQQRQEVQKQIADLNRELRERQIELRREKLQEQAKEAGQKQNPLADNAAKQPARQEEKEKSASEEEKEAKTPVSVPHGSMSAILSAGTSREQAGAQGRTARALQGDVRLMQSEIAQDKRNGQNTRRKEEALKALEERADRASGSQIGILADTAQTLRRANIPDDRKTAAQKPDNRIAAITGAPQRGPAPKNAVQRYNIGKQYSNVTLNV